jgi:hypoxanthine phosphoribosyltransferase
MADRHTVLFSAEEILATVRDLAASIDRDLGRSRLVVITVLKGAVMFSCDLVRAMETETELVFLSASSYSDGFTPGETLRLQEDIELDVAGRDVLIVDDIIDTGRTLTELARLIGLQRPRSISTVALVNKTSRRAADAEPTYSGLDIGEEFIYGYGLDWDERYRDLPFIALANP